MDISQEMTYRPNTLRSMTQTAELDIQPNSPQPPSGRPSFTITEAATACAVSRKTITRKLADLAEAGAAKDQDGIWRIPVEALLSVGLHPGRSVPSAGARPNTASRAETLDLRSARTAPTVAAEPVDTVTVSRDRWDDLRIRLARAEAESVERGRALEDARLALRALTAGPAVSEPVVHYATPQRPVGQPTSMATAEEVEVEITSGPPPTPVPTSLAADSSVWDTLLPTGPRTASTPQVTTEPATHVGSSAPATHSPAVGSLMPLSFPSGQPAGAHEPTTVPGPTLDAAMVNGQPRRKWWGGRR